MDINGTFELDGHKVTFSITGTGDDEYNVTTRGVERHAEACKRVEDLQRVLSGNGVVFKRHWGNAS